MENSKMLIDPEPLKQQVQDCINRCYRFGIDSVGPLAMFLDYIKEAPRIEAKEVAHAKWKLDRYATEWTCSNCEGEMLYKVTTYGGGQYHDIDNIFAPYCPHCGAKMDKENID